MATGFELIAASGRGDIAESIRLIEECHVSLDEHDAMGQTPLHVSRADAVPRSLCHLTHASRAQLLAANTPYCDGLAHLLLHREHTPVHVSALQLAAYHGHRKLVKYLLSKGADVNALTNVRCPPPGAGPSVWRALARPTIAGAMDGCGTCSTFVRRAGRDDRGCTSSRGGRGGDREDPARA